MMVLSLVLVTIHLTCVIGTPFYYGTYRSYGTGDTIIQVSHANGGPKTPYSKWQVECLDGEAMTGVSDFVFDFGGIVNVWCKFMFPYKPAVRDHYPFYPACHVRSYTKDFFCYDPNNHTSTSNTFMTGLWDNDYSFWLYREGVDNDQPYKCCKTPPGYYLDYVSCYYIWTHDQYWEYYDSQFFLVQCATGYVMTGIAKKKSPIVRNEYRLDWIQCCRLGYGAVENHPPPAIPTPDGGPTAYSTGQPAQDSDHIPSAYLGQYRGKRSVAVPSAIQTKRHTILAEQPLEHDGLTPVHAVNWTQAEIDFNQRPVINVVRGESAESTM